MSIVWQIFSWGDTTHVYSPQIDPMAYQMKDTTKVRLVNQQVLLRLLTYWNWVLGNLQGQK